MHNWETLRHHLLPICFALALQSALLITRGAVAAFSKRVENVAAGDAPQLFRLWLCSNAKAQAQMWVERADTATNDSMKVVAEGLCTQESSMRSPPTKRVPRTLLEMSTKPEVRVSQPRREQIRQLTNPVAQNNLRKLGKRQEISRTMPIASCSNQADPSLAESKEPRERVCTLASVYRLPAKTCMRAS